MHHLLFLNLGALVRHRCFIDRSDACDSNLVAHVSVQHVGLPEPNRELAACKTLASTSKIGLLRYIKRLRSYLINELSH